MSGHLSGKRGPGLLVGAAIAAVGIAIIASTAGTAIAPTYARVGPQVIPYCAGIALSLMGLYFMVIGWIGGADRVVADTDETDWRALVIIAVAFVFVAFALKPAGFVVTAAVLFFAVAWAFGSRRIVRDALIAVALALTAYLVFTRLLNLQLPAGLLKGIL
jgi:putative tricarboxylic transport membrane protein